MSDEPLARIEAQVTHLVEGHEELRTGQDELRGGQLLILKRLDKLEIGQEGLTDDIKGLADGQAALRIEMQRGFAEVREEIGRRVDPLETAVRSLRG